MATAGKLDMTADGFRKALENLHEDLSGLEADREYVCYDI